MAKVAETGYAIEDLMISCMARMLKDGEVVLYGVASHVPAIACMLAKSTHAPRLVHMNIMGVDPRPTRMSRSTSHSRMIDGAVSYHGLPKIFDFAQRGRVDLMFFSGAQIDKQGNLNLSVIRRPEGGEKRLLQLPGGAGEAILSHTAKRLIYWMPKHNRMTFVENVDFITLPTHLPEIRRKLTAVVTNLAIFTMNNDTGLLELSSIHPGFTIEQVRDATGFALKTAPQVAETQPPNTAESKLIESLDPQGLRLTRG